MSSVGSLLGRTLCCAVILMLGQDYARSETGMQRSAGIDSPVQTSICEVLRDPQHFDGMMVEVRATVMVGYEVFAVQDAMEEDCGTLWLSYEGGGPTVSLSLGLLTLQVERPPVILRHDRQFKRFQKLLNEQMYPRSRKEVCVACNHYEVTASLTGRIDAAEEGRGFGHMNAYQLRLVLQRVAEVSTVDLSSNYDPAAYSATPVKLPSGQLRGKVLDGTGNPVVGAEVTLRSVADESSFLHDLTEWADERGRFAFDDVPPGMYVAGVNLDSPPSDQVPFPATYFPGTQDSTKAEPLAMKDGQRRRIVIRLDQELQRRTIPVKVIWPDGKPVLEANVWLKETRDPIPVVGGTVSHTDSEGLFDLIGLRGIDYVVQADIYLKPLYKPYCSEQVSLPSGEEVRARVTLVLTREGDVCRHEAVFGTPPADQ